MLINSYVAHMKIPLFALALLFSVFGVKAQDPAVAVGHPSSEGERKNIVGVSYVLGDGGTEGTIPGIQTELNGPRGLTQGVCVSYGRKLRGRWLLYTDHSGLQYHHTSVIQWGFPGGSARIYGYTGATGVRLTLDEKERFRIGAGLFFSAFRADYQWEYDDNWVHFNGLLFTAVSAECNAQAVIPLTRNQVWNLQGDVVFRAHQRQLNARLGLAMKF